VGIVVGVKSSKRWKSTINNKKGRIFSFYDH
jgi:hypothetical protein